MPLPVSILTAACILLAGIGYGATSASAQPATSEPELDAFGAQVRAYLLSHPEVIMEALQVLEARRTAAEAEATKKTIGERHDELFNDPQTPTGGNPSGDATLVEFFDYNCPYCKRVAPTVTALTEDDPDLRLVYKEIPILGPDSQFAARAALAADQQGQYLAFHEALMSSGEKVTEARVLEIARQVGLDVERLQRDMTDPSIDAAIQRNLALASALGITGTPSFVIGDRIVPGAADQTTLEGLVTRAREGS